MFRVIIKNIPDHLHHAISVLHQLGLAQNAHINPGFDSPMVYGDWRSQTDLNDLLGVDRITAITALVRLKRSLPATAEISLVMSA